MKQNEEMEQKLQTIEQTLGHMKTELNQTNKTVKQVSEQLEVEKENVMAKTQLSKELQQQIEEKIAIVNELNQKQQQFVEENHQLKETIQKLKTQMPNSSIAITTLTNDNSQNNEMETKASVRRRGRPRKSPQTATKAPQRKLKKKASKEKSDEENDVDSTDDNVHVGESTNDTHGDKKEPTVSEKINESTLISEVPLETRGKSGLLYGVTNTGAANQSFPSTLYATQPKATGGSGSSNMALTDFRRANNNGSGGGTSTTAGVTFPRTEHQRMLSQPGSTYNSNTSPNNLIKLSSGQTLTYGQYYQLLTQAQQIKTDNNSATSTNNGSVNGVVVSGGLDNHTYLMPQWQRIPQHSNTGSSSNNESNGNEVNNNNGSNSGGNANTNTSGNSNNSNTPQPLIFPHYLPPQLVIQLQQKKGQAQQTQSSSHIVPSSSGASQNANGQSQQPNGQTNSSAPSHTTATPIYLPHNYHQLLLQQQYPNAQFVVPGNQGYAPQQGQQVAFMQFQQS